MTTASLTVSAPAPRALRAARLLAAALLATAACGAVGAAPAPSQPAGHAAAPAGAANATATGIASDERFSHGYFDDAPIYRPRGEPRGVVLLVAGQGSWSARDATLADTLRRQGALVAGLEIDKMVQAMRKDDDRCLAPQGDFDNFSRVLQARYQLNGYRPPVLMGSDKTGSALVYAVLGASAADTFSGVASLAFDPSDVRMPMTLCKDLAPAAQPRQGAARHYDLRPATTLSAPWLAFPATETASSRANTFVAAIPQQATLMPVFNDVSPDAQLSAAFERLRPRQATTVAPPAAVGDLPLVEAPATGAPNAATRDLLALMISGDGGWAGIDKDLANAMNRDGIPVIGFDSLRYFWKARTPESTTQDVVRVLRYYQSRPEWQRTRILLIGYSQGADVMPFVLNRLPEDLRAQVASAVLIGMGEKASFEFHVSNWLKSDDDGLPTLPEAHKLPPGLALCAYGIEDKDAICPKLDKPGSPVRILGLKGGHHFDGDYDKLAAVLLKAVTASPAAAPAATAPATGAPADQNRSAR